MKNEERSEPYMKNTVNEHRNFSLEMRRRRSPLFPEAELRNEGFISRKIFALKVAEQSLATTNHLDEAAASLVVLLVDLQVFSNLLDAGGQYRYLHLSTTDVLLARLRCCDSLCFVVCCNHQVRIVATFSPLRKR